MPATAVDFKIGDVDVKVKGAVTFGTTFRADTRNAETTNRANAAVLGVSGDSPGGRNSDDGNLNFERGDRVSTVLKGFADAEFKYRNLGALVRAKAWHDYELMDGDRPWGNLPNGLTPNQPLSDRGFRKLGRFSGVAFADAYVYGRFAPGGMPLYVRAGEQTIPWGTGFSIGGGLSVINPVDNAARVRAGAISEETRVPFGAIFGTLGLTKRINVEGFYQYKFRPSQGNGCGTFFSGADWVDSGCDKVVIGAGSDRVSLASGSFLKRATDLKPSNSGQYGIGATYRAEELSTDFRAYYVKYGSRVPFFDAFKSSRVGAPFVAGDPGGTNPAYFIEYPEDIRMVGLNFATRLAGSSFAGEISHRPNQPVSLNAGDIAAALTSATAATPLRADLTATPSGGVFRGYDRLKVTQVQFGVAKPLGKALGASSLTVSGEVGLKYVNNLPDVNVRRYGRPDVYGAGPVGGVCSATATAKQCSTDGYVSKAAWGYRLRAALRYPGVVDGLDLLPTVTFAHDVKGWSYDGLFSEGRQFAVLALRGEYQKRYMAEIAWSPVSGGKYNVPKDRDFVSLSVGVNF